MKKFRSYIKANGFFIFLLVILIAITGSLSIYTLYQKQQEKPSLKEPVTKEEDPEPKKNAEITSFEGYYDATSKQVKLNWTYQENSTKVTSIKLLYKDGSDPITVTQFPSYDLPIELYNLPTGYNDFTLRLVLDNGDTLEKNTKVKIDFVLSAKQTIEQTDYSTKVTLTYVYDKSNPVSVPSIQCLSDTVDCSVTNYIDTKVIEDHGRMSAQTTFEFIWSERPIKHAMYYVRWSFKDEDQNVYQNYDFQVTKGK